MEGPGQGLVGRRAALALSSRSLAAAADEPATAASHCAAEPCPALAWAPVSSTRGAQSAMPDAAARSAWANRSTNALASSPEIDPGTDQRQHGVDVTHRGAEELEGTVDAARETARGHDETLESGCDTGPGGSGAG